MAVAAGTEGSAKASVGISGWTPTGAAASRGTLVWNLDFTAATFDGAATLVQGTVDGTKRQFSGADWSTGFTLGWQGKGDFDQLITYVGADDDLRAEARNICSVTCEVAPKAEGCTAFNAALSADEVAWQIANANEVTGLNLYEDDGVKAWGQKADEQLPATEAGCSKARSEFKKALAPHIKRLETPGARVEAETLAALAKKYTEAAKACSDGCGKATKQDLQLCSYAELVCLNQPSAPPEAAAAGAERCSKARQACTDSAKPGSEPEVCAQVKGVHAKLSTPFVADDQTPPGVDSLCAAGLAHYKEGAGRNSRLRELSTYRFPSFTLAFGAHFIASRQKFLQEDGTVMVGMTERPAYSSETKTFPGVAAGLSGAGILRESGLTLEARFLFRRTHKPNTTKGKWCSNVGGIGTEPDAVVVQSCDERTLGAPTLSNAFSLDAQLGWADLRQARWRISAGPRYEYDVDAQRQTLGLHIPVSVAFLNIPRANEKIDFDGVFRFTPFASQVLSAADGKTPFAAGLMLEILTKRGIFATKYDTF